MTDEINTHTKIAELKGISTQEELSERLTRDVLVVTFNKTNGDQRVMTCTKNLEVIPEENHPPKNDPPKRKQGLITVWDTNAQGWRSFYYDKVTDVSEVQHE